MKSFKITSFYKTFLLIFFTLASLYIFSTLSAPKAVAAGTCTASNCNRSSGCMCNGTSCQTQKQGCSNSTVVCGGAANVPCCVYEWALGSACQQSSCNGGAGCGGSNCTSPNACTLPEICRAEGIPVSGKCTDDTKVCCSFSGGGDGGIPVGENPGKQDNPPCYFAGCDSDQGSINLKCDGATCNTAFGPISTTAQGFVTSFFRVLLSIVGVISVLLIIISGYKLMTSQGNPERVQGAREQLTAAIIGLLFIIFSLAILQTIGVEILRLPGFSQ